MLENFEVTRLEKLYIKRRNKIFAKFAGAGILVLAVFAFVLYLALKTDEPKVAQIEQNTKSDENFALAEVAKNEVKNEVKSEAIKAAQIDEEQLKADLKLQIKEELREEQIVKELKEKTRLKYELERARKYRQEIEPETDMTPYFEPEVAYEEEPRKKVVQNVIKEEPKPRKSKGVAQITSSVAAPSLANLEANYEHTKDPKDALALAQKYYEQRDYKNAAKWAFELNGIDKSDPNGWLIFAKAKYKSGNKTDAIKVLEVYKSRASNANEIVSLIAKMQSGAEIE